jgi:alpha-mannosidase
MPKLRLFIVPHTHYDAEVFLNREVTLRWGSDNILDMLYLLDRDPEYRFTLDQRCYIEGFEALHPEQMEKLKAHVASGRVEMAGGMHVMPDTNIPSGESLVRQITFGRAYMDTTFNNSNRDGWMLDSFGHHPQMPQIMRLGGLDTYNIQRGVSDPQHPAGFWWIGLDGSKIRVEWMPHTYALIGVVPNTFPAFKQVVDHIVNLVQPYIYNNQFAALSGVDLAEPIQHLPVLARQYNQSQNDVELVIATMEEYFAAQPPANFIEREGDLNPVFVGCYTTRIKLKQKNRALENAITSTEKLMAINHANAGTPIENLDHVWEPVLFNQFHDIICGSHLDEIYEHALDRCKLATTRAETLTQNALTAFTDQINTQGEGIPLVVANFLGRERTDAARCTVGLGNERWEWLALYDEDGSEIPLQLQDVHRHPDGSIKRADLIFIAQVPAFGYRTYFLRGGQERKFDTDLWSDSANRAGIHGIITGNLRPNLGRMGNNLIDVEMNLRTGAINAIRLRALDWNVVDSKSDNGFATVCRQEDQGDPWEYYGPLRGGITSTDPLIDPVPGRGEKRAVFTDEYGGIAHTHGGPVMTEMVVSSPFNDGKFKITARLYAGLRRVELATELVNQQQFVRYRSIFPLNLTNPSITYEIPFGAIDRPEGEYPAQNWVDVHNGARGVALLNRGLPGHSLVGNVLTASLLKCIKVVEYGAGGYSAKARDSLGFELGVEHSFDQAIVPHDGDWKSAQIYHEAQAFNSPLIVRKTTRHTGSLPPSGSFMTLEPDHILLHAFYYEGDTLVIRISEAEGRAGDGQVNLHWPVSSAAETDFMGKGATELATTERGFNFSIRPFEIKTFRIALS